MTLREHFKTSLVLSLLIMAGSMETTAQQSDIYFEMRKNFSIFSSVYENIALEYVDEVDPEILMRTGIDAMLETLDPYTVMFNESQNEQAEIMSRGNYAGIGIQAGYRDGNVVVIAPSEGGPAEQAGIRAGDVIVAVDDVSTEGLQPEEVNNLASGEVGSEVAITIERFGVDQPLDFTLERKRIEVTNVSYSGFVGSDENTGYIKLTQFGNNSAEEVREALVGLTEAKDINGLVLDLRDNPGGILQEAVRIIDKFVEPGLSVVDIRGRIQQYNEAFITREPIMFDKPVIVLINRGSASASEVVAGALQDLDRAVIIGEQSFGKGLVQIVKPLPYNTSLKITISRYYIPSGRSIQSVEYTHQGRNAVMMDSNENRKEFKTRNGRTVFEGRGIDPDVNGVIDNMNILEIALMQQGMYFDFATEYEAEHSSFEAETLPRNVFESFKVFLEEQDFKYSTDSEKLLAELSEQLQEVKGADAQLQLLEESIAAEKQMLFEESTPSIERALYLELVSRYEGATGKSKASLRSDTAVNEAIQFILDNNKRELLLAGD
jgi:carboxyl-terminal processing protease